MVKVTVIQRGNSSLSSFPPSQYYRVRIEETAEDYFTCRESGFRLVQVFKNDRR